MEKVDREAAEEQPPPKTCHHGRMIDDVLTHDGKRTGKVRCVECGAEFKDPYLGLK